VLIRSAYRGESSRAGWTSEAHLLEGDRIHDEQVLELITSPGSLVVVAEAVTQAGRPGELTGCCHLADLGNGRAYFGTFAVSPARQSAGLGGRLMAEAERLAVAAFGARELELAALSPQEKLIAWYERLGFVPTGERKPFPGHPVFARPTQDDLDLVTMVKPLDR